MSDPILFHAGRRQRGVALPVALIVLTGMILAAVTLIRSVDSATVVASNLTYKQRAARAGDEGIRTAYLWLKNKAVTAPADLNNTDTAAGYYSTQHADDPGWNPAAKWDNNADSVDLHDTAGHTITYVIHRLCTQPNLAYNAGNNQCATYSGASSTSSGGSQSSDAAEFPTITYVYYRITARVVGPRNTAAYVQSLVLVPAS